MYYDRELLMIGEYEEELRQYAIVNGRSMTALNFKKICAKVWAANELINIISVEDAAVSGLLVEEAPYSVAMLVQCFMIDMEYCIHICHNVETTVVWQAAHEVGNEVLERLKAMP